MDYLVVEVRENSLPLYVTQEMQKSLVNTIDGTKGRRVLIYKLR
jgi:bifunctional DNase/RNase